MTKDIKACKSCCTQSGCQHHPYWQKQLVIQICQWLIGLVQPKMQLKNSVLGSNPGFAILSWICLRAVLGNICEGLTLAICLSGWAKPSVSKVCHPLLGGVMDASRAYNSGDRGSNPARGMKIFHAFFIPTSVSVTTIRAGVSGVRCNPMQLGGWHLWMIL